MSRNSKFATRRSFYLHLITFSTILVYLSSIPFFFYVPPCLSTLPIHSFTSIQSLSLSLQSLFESIKPFLVLLYGTGVDNVWSTTMIVKMWNTFNTCFCALYAPWKETRFRFHFHYQKKVKNFYFLSRAETKFAQQRDIFFLHLHSAFKMCCVSFYSYTHKLHTVEGESNYFVYTAKSWVKHVFNTI